LFEFRPEDGTIYLKDERMVACSGASFGILRRQLVQSFGIDIARRVLWQIGYSQGYRDYLSVRQLFGKEAADNAGTRIYAIMGLGRVEVLLDVQDNGNACFQMETIVRNSVEAEEHLAMFGQGEDSACWQTQGYASGYEGARIGREVYFKELMCKGRGDPYCRFLARDAGGWGNEIETFHRLYSPSAKQDPVALEELRAEIRRLHELSRKQRLALVQCRKRTRRVEPTADSPAAQALKLAERAHFIVRGQMTEAIEQAASVARLDTTVLVCGETGTGKEFFVNLIYNQSSRAKAPLVSVNCAALTETLLESELFGHVRGAFTGAVGDKVGLFEVASQGTLFLDEIGEMPPALQAKMLRTLENGEIRRVGSTKIIRVNPRIIAATNRDLLVEINVGRFRQDLFFRLNSFVLHLPPLRQTRESIPLLVWEFLQTFSETFGKRITSIAPEAMSLLMNYAWPGNVRELKHAIERSVLVAYGDTLEVQDLPPEIASSAPAEDENSLGVKDQEQRLIRLALEQSHGNRQATAKALKISLSTLWRKMKVYGLFEYRGPAETAGPTVPRADHVAQDDPSPGDSLQPEVES
jgi:DNA-binding NtrC family response regulator/predicted hydrocarbon binding protein